jgi:uncharacterized protein (TIGR00251 family)
MSESPPWLRAHADGACLQIKVVPRASRNELTGILGDRLKIRIAAPPVDSAANGELIAFLSAQLDLPRGALRISQGPASRNKTVEVRQVTGADLAARVAKLLPASPRAGQTGGLGAK